MVMLIHFSGEAAFLTSFITPMNIWSITLALIHYIDECLANHYML